MCGPMDVFSVNVSGDGSSSTLSTQSVNDTVNGTRVQCGMNDVDETIYVIGIYVFIKNLYTLSDASFRPSIA